MPENSPKWIRIRKRLELTLPVDVLEMLTALAEGTSKSSVVERLVRSEFKKKK